MPCYRPARSVQRLPVRARGRRALRRLGPVRPRAGRRLRGALDRHRSHARADATWRCSSATAPARWCSRPTRTPTIARASSRSALHAEGKHAKKLWVEAPGSAFSPQRITHEMIDEGRHFPQHGGPLRLQARRARACPRCCARRWTPPACKLDDVDLFLFHQANLRINEFVAQKLEIPPEKCLQQHPEVRELLGGLDPDAARTRPARRARSREGDLVAMTGFGSGFTWAQRRSAGSVPRSRLSASQTLASATAVRSRNYRRSNEIEFRSLTL